MIVIFYRQKFWKIIYTEKQNDLVQKRDLYGQANNKCVQNYILSVQANSINKNTESEMHASAKSAETAKVRKSAVQHTSLICSFFF